MKFRHSMIWLHTWAGLVLSGLLYFMFITGSAGYFDDEITRWMQPEIPMLNGHFDHAEQIPAAEQRLQQLAPNADQLYMQFPVGRSPFFTLWWHIPKGHPDGGWHSEKLDPNTGHPITTRHTEGGEGLYRLHYNLHYLPTQLAHWITSLAAMFMLVAMVSGVIIHRRIFKDFFNFRRHKKLTSWMDMHNLLGVLPLPFHLMITYSGLVLLMFSTMIAIPVSSFGVGKELRHAYDAVFEEPHHREASGIAAPGLPLITMYQMAIQQGDGQVAFVNVDNPGDSYAVVEIGMRAVSGLGEFHTLHYDAVSGKPLDNALIEAEHSGAKKVYTTLEELHEGIFAPPFLRWLYFLSGLMGAAMIATGTVLWILKRRELHAKAGLNTRGLYTVEGLTVGTVIGLPIAIASYFYANRLLPVDLASRASWEINGLFITWLIMLLHPFLLRQRKSMQSLWLEQLLIAAGVYAGIPILNMLTSDQHVMAALWQRDWVLVGFDLFMLVLAASFILAYYKLKLREPHGDFTLQLGDFSR